ncbi:VWA domain-containing protein [Galbibacter mesophilus]|uniref:VWA domain-containing protein n=1 Tax=Galbibacter mesophilus TaxID=379069 RepID=UPI00191E139C|nr:VWA domain-containing protein [Galbibacter mesophilus]MCM5662963.1 VWA domain-containing protein [Galbibacter mesophilus]
MKIIKSIFSILAITSLLIACGSSDDDFNSDGGIPDCLGFEKATLKLTIQDEFTTLPGKVSVFFKVNDTEGNAVPNLQASNFNIFEQGSNDNCPRSISASEAFSRISPNEQIFNTNTILVLDLSNSVLSSSLEELKVASISFIDEVMPTAASEQFKMAIYWFDGEEMLHELNPLTTDKDSLKMAVEGITEDISTDASTNLYGAVVQSTKIADDILKENEEKDILAASSVVIFTDGTDQAARVSESTAISTVENADENISFFTIGLGNEIDAEVLERIGKTGTAVASNKDELVDTFEDISENVAGQAKSYYLFEYCSPKRSGVNDLIIQAVQGEKQGSVKTSFDATGFTGGCK